MPVRPILGLLIAIWIAAGCGQTPPPASLAATTDPVPLPDDLAGQLQQDLSRDGFRLEPPDTTPGETSADKALGIAGRDLQQYLAQNHAPALDVRRPDGLVRRRFVVSPDAPSSVWVVVYRYTFTCQGDAGTPSPCPATSYYLIDDRTGEIVYRVSNT